MMQCDAVAALLPFPSLVDIRILRHIDDLDKFRPRQFTRPPGGGIIGIARDPQRLQAVSVRQRQEQADASGGVVMPAVLWFDAIADVTTVFGEVLGVADSQVDTSDSFLLAG
jgi:hypothetical protein